MVNAGGDLILALIWFLIVLLHYFLLLNMSSGQLIDEDTKGLVLLVLICIDMCLQLVLKPMFPWNLSPDMHKR